VGVHGNSNDVDIFTETVLTSFRSAKERTRGRVEMHTEFWSET
jgi:hypothetical protein